jgi:hypothetical protein
MNKFFCTVLLFAIATLAKANMIVHYRGLVVPHTIYAHIDKQPIRVLWPEAAALFPVGIARPTDYRELSTEKRIAFNKAAWSNPNSWGHIAIEFESPIHGNSKTIGWRPKIWDPKMAAEVSSRATPDAQIPTISDTEAGLAT